MQRLEVDVVLAKKVLVVLKAFQQLPLRESAAALAESGLQTLHPYPDAVCTRKCAATFYSTLLAPGAREHPRWLRMLGL